MKKLNTILLSGASLLALAFPAGAAQQSSQTQDAESGFESITVTARRVEENLQEVPLAVYVMSPDTIQRTDMRNLSDLTMNLPGFGTCCGRGFITLVSLRGTAGVANYFSDVPVELFAGRGYTFDIESMQVLKGPQGTLFGVANNGGAILENPRRPGSEFGGYGQVTVGTYGRLIVEGAMDVPLVQDKVNARIAFTTGHQNGIGQRMDTLERFGNENYWAVRGSLDFQISEKLNNYTIANYYASNETIFQTIMKSYNPTGSTAAVYGVANMEAALQQQNALGTYKIPGMPTPFTPFVKQQILDLINKTTYDIDDVFQIKNTIAYGSYANLGTGLYFGNKLGPIYTDQRSEFPDPTVQWTEELQLIATDLFDRFDVQLGTFHTGSVNKGKADKRGAINYTSSFNIITPTSSTSSSRTRAVYGQVTYDASEIIEGLSFTGGYRYTWDMLTSGNTRYNAPPVGVAYTETTRIAARNRYLYGAAKFSSGSHTLGVQYQITPDLMVYFTNAKGYSRGGFNLTAPLPPQQVYGPEVLDNLEVGIKSMFDIGSVKTRVNLSAYQGDYQGKQVIQSFLAQLLPPPAPLQLLSATFNVGKAKPKGFEADFDFLLTDDLRVGGNLSYIHAYYTDFPSLDGLGNPINKAGLIFVAVPAWSYNLRASYDLSFIDEKYGSVTLNADFAYVGKQMRDTAASFPDPIYYHGYMPPMRKVNASIDWKDIFDMQGLSANFYGTNLTKLKLEAGGTCTWQSLGICSPSPAQPRMFGVRMRYDF